MIAAKRSAEHSSERREAEGIIAARRREGPLPTPADDFAADAAEVLRELLEVMHERDVEP